MVFCHGLLGFDYLGPTSLPPLQISHWRGIREVLESNGVDVLITRVPATASVADRAAILAETIAEKYEGQEVNLIGHSMVCRTKPMNLWQQWAMELTNRADWTAVI